MMAVCGSDAADEWDRDQEAEQRETGDGLADVGEPKCPAAGARAGGEQKACGDRDSRCDQDGAEDEHEMLAEELNAFFKEVL